MTCIHPSVDNKNRPKMEEISQGANVVNVVQNEDSVLICFFFVCVLPSAPISPRIQLKSSKWNWLMRVECLGKEGRRLCPAWAEDTEGRSQLWKQEELGVKGNSGEGRAYGREDCFRRKNASQQDSVVTCQNLCEYMAWGC